MRQVLIVHMHDHTDDQTGEEILQRIEDEFEHEVSRVERYTDEDPRFREIPGTQS